MPSGPCGAAGPALDGRAGVLHRIAVGLFQRTLSFQAGGTV